MGRFGVSAAAVLGAAGAVLGQDGPTTEILLAVNVERSRMGLEPLTLSERLQRLAQARAEGLKCGSARTLYW